MGLTQVSKDGVKNDAIDASKLPANSVGASELADNAVDTNAIADQAVALSKLPHGDGNSNGKFLRANNGADPSFESIPAGTTINNNAADRIITGEGGTTLNGESGLTYTGSRLTQSSGDTIIDQTNNGYGGLRIVDSSAGDYSVSYILGRNSGLSAHVFKYNGRTQNQSPWNNNGTGNEMGRWSAAGISFNGDTAAANALNDYEEGTFTFHLRSEGGSNASMVGRVGRYVKIGQTVHIIAGGQYSGDPDNRGSNNAIEFTNLPFTNVSTGLGGAGLPFPVMTQSLSSSGLSSMNGSQPYVFVGRLDNNATSGRIVALKGDGDQNPQNASLAVVNNSQLYVMFTYQTTA